MSTSEGLSADDKRLLDFAAERWRYAGNHAAAVEAEFGLTVTRYFQKLNRLLDDPDAEAYDPVVVRRLRRVREGRASARAARGPRE